MKDFNERFLFFVLNRQRLSELSYSQNLEDGEGTLVQEVDGFHAGIFLIADLQLVELAEKINELLHNLHSVLTEPFVNDRGADNGDRDT